MNNEIKARDIALENVEHYHTIDDNGTKYLTHCYNECKKSAMEMAQWKDEQFSKFLLWIDDNYVIRRFTDGEPMTYGDLVDNFENKSYERDTTKTD